MYKITLSILQRPAYNHSNKWERPTGARGCWPHIFHGPLVVVVLVVIIHAECCEQLWFFKTATIFCCNSCTCGRLCLCRYVVGLIREERQLVVKSLRLGATTHRRNDQFYQRAVPSNEYKIPHQPRSRWFWRVFLFFRWRTQRFLHLFKLRCRLQKADDLRRTKR